jgi:Spy/CpxP family protein refolding chaperone
MISKHRPAGPSSRIPVALALALIPACNTDGNTTETPGAPRAPAQTASAPARTASSEAKSSSSAPNATVETARHGTAAHLLHAAYRQPLTGAQKAVLDRLRIDLEASETRKNRAFEDLKVDLAEGIRRGAIDSAQMKRHERTVTSAVREHLAKKVEVLDELHATLDGTQRSALVAVVRAERTAPENTTAPGPPGARGTGPKGSDERLKDRLELLKSELSLDEEQEQRILALPLMKDEQRMLGKVEGFREQRRKRAEALLAAFPSDSFEAKGIVAPTSPRAPGHIAERGVAFVSQLVSILKPEQRAKLASKLDELWMDMAPHRQHDGDAREDSIE